MSLSGDLAAIARGKHPLSQGRPPWAQIELHPAAPPPLDRDAPGPRCGSCAQRQPRIGRDRSRGAQQRPRCLLDRGDGRVQQTDVPAWWPACTDHRERTT